MTVKSNKHKTHAIVYQKLTLFQNKTICTIRSYKTTHTHIHPTPPIEQIYRLRLALKKQLSVVLTNEMQVTGAGKLLDTSKKISLINLIDLFFSKYCHGTNKP